MAVADRSIDPRILDSARTEFLASGFEKASLKTICEGAGVTTGALYKRYKGKEDLFSAVVEQTVADLYEVAHARGDKDPAAMSDQELIKAWDMDGADMMWWFRFLYDRRDDFYIVSYEGLNLGFVKVSGGIAKNHYPRGLRREWDPDNE